MQAQVNKKYAELSRENDGVRREAETSSQNHI